MIESHTVFGEPVKLAEAQLEDGTPLVVAVASGLTALLRPDKFLDLLTDPIRRQLLANALIELRDRIEDGEPWVAQ